MAFSYCIPFRESLRVFTEKYGSLALILVLRPNLRVGGLRRTAGQAQFVVYKNVWHLVRSCVEAG